ncbi:EAL domain-containing protein [Neorhizobium sp. NCHU2750]|uniref:bifunctional diguanylate cyclase/phosphodiesterase n=1 Tax=Neorhizobium sp. NCHU2750 TaxID=1825976 RepID=UPI000E71B2AA|nr:diguanylate phosphodiesterase [Neorhizobium sp. NCHU2750]
MFKVIECVAVQHDRALVALAAGICVVGMLAFFLIHRRAVECSEKRRRFWLAVAAVTGGLSVWATHFVAMLAYQGTIAIEFELFRTILSAVIAAVGFWASLRILEEGSARAEILAGIAATLTVAAMHFLGTEAIRAAATIEYEIGMIPLAVVLSCILFTLAFRMALRRKSRRGLWVAVAAGVVSICLLHFTAMSATTLVPDPSLPEVSLDGDSGRIWMVWAVSIVVGLIVISAVTASFLDRYLTDLRGFANATLEGLAVVREGVIIEANARFAAMLGLRDRDVIGRTPDSLLVAADGISLIDVERTRAVEAAPLKSGPLKPGRQTFLEVAVHTIEYRGRSCQVLAVRDLTEKRIAELRVEHMARHDALTDLPNRSLFSDKLEAAIDLAGSANERLAVLALDLDRFKAVNDVFGHAEGDRVLVKVADILRRCTGEADTPARIGGDEFVILQPGLDQPTAAYLLADRILDTFRQEMNVNFDPKAVGVSIGVAIFPEDGHTADELRNAADMALYNAKFNGRGTAAFYSADMDADLRQRRLVESELRHAVLRDQLSLVFQPLFDASNGICTGYEALMRWNHPDLGAISPAEFIPVAEETGIIVTLGEWALREACRTAASWDDGLAVAVNVSAVQFRFPDLVGTVAAALNDSGLDPKRLELEITETSLLENRDAVLAMLKKLKALGVLIVIDDFGTGYSSLGNLHAFPFDKIKIDRSFIWQMEESESARAIVKAIIGLGKSLDLPVVAEGIETFGQHRMVIEQGIEQLQGFLLGKPKSAGEVEVLSGLRRVPPFRKRG